MHLVTLNAGELHNNQPERSNQRQKMSRLNEGVVRLRTNTEALAK